jgi:hypothetical protein
MDAHVTARSQTYRLHQQALEADIRHGQEVRADVPRVRVTAVTEDGGWGDRGWFGRRRATPTDQAEIFFCNMGRVRVREVLEHGDRGPLPTGVVVEHLAVPESGTYDLLNVLVRSNGDLRLVVDDETQVVRTQEPEVATSSV